MTPQEFEKSILISRTEDTIVMWDAFVLEQNIIQTSPELTAQAIKASEEMYNLVKLLKGNKP